MTHEQFLMRPEPEPEPEPESEPEDTEPVVRDPEAWQAVAAEGRRFA